MGALGGALLAVMIFTFPLGWIYKRAREVKKANVFYFVFSICMVGFVIIIGVLSSR